MDFYYGSWRQDLSGVFNKNVKVPLQEVKLVGTSSSNRERHGGKGRGRLEGNVFPWAMLLDKRSSFTV